MIFDTHIHLNDVKYDLDLNDTIDRAIDNGILSMAIIGWNKESSLKAIEICRIFNNYRGLKLYPVGGLHPSNVLEENDKDLNWLVELIENKKIVAIGEIGLDLYWDKSYLELQLQMFNKQMRIAEKYQMPVIIHNREAMQLTFDVIKEYSNVTGIMHCYSGSVEMAKEILKMGYKLGIGGVVTYKNTKLIDVIENIDLNSFVSETDGPYLPPIPYRGKRNEPTYIIEVIKKISELKKISIDDTENALYNNAIDVFGKKEKL